MKNLLLFTLVLHFLTFSLAAISLSVPSTVLLGEPMNVTVTTDEWISGDNVQRYLPGACPTTNDCYIDYHYVDNNGVSVLSFSGISDRLGTFEFRYIRGTTNLATSLNCTIVEDANIDSPTTVLLGQPIVVQFTVSPYHDTGDFIGRYPVGGCPTTNECYLQYRYVPEGGSGNVTFDGVDNELTTFEFRYNLRNSFTIANDATTIVSTGSLTTKPTHAVGEPIVIQFTTSPYHSLGDYIAMYTTGSCNVSNDCYRQYRYVPEGASGNVTFDGITNELVTLDFRYLITSNLFLFSTSTSIVSIASLSVQRYFQIGGTVGVQFRSGEFHSLSDYVAIYERGACPVSHDCYISYRYVPEGASGYILMDAPRTPGEYEVRYLSPSNALLATSNITTGVVTLGLCATGCSNAGTLCTSTSECTGCGAATCEAVPGPTFSSPSPLEGSEIGTRSGVAVQFVVSARITQPGLGPMAIFFDGLPATAVVNTNIGNTTLNSTVTFVPGAVDEGYEYYVCYIVSNVYGIYSERRCFTLKVFGTTCYSWGDPHMVSFDDVHYDFQGVGDFYMVKSSTYATDGFSVQVRFQQCSPGSSISCNKAVAVQLNGQVISAYMRENATPRLLVNGEDRTSNVNTTFSGGFVSTGDYYGWDTLYIEFVNEVRVKVSAYKSNYPTVLVSLPGSYSAKVFGLCGTYNGVEADDYVFPNGTSITSPSYEETYDYGVTWRVPENESLFNYTASFQPYNTVNLINFTPARDTPIFQSTDLEAEARDICGSLGLSTVLYNACLFDIALSNSVEAALGVTVALAEACLEEQGISFCNSTLNCPNNCYFRGKCENKQCICANGYIGADCSTRVTQDSSAVYLGASIVLYLLVLLLL